MYKQSFWNNFYNFFNVAVIWFPVMHTTVVKVKWNETGKLSFVMKDLDLQKFTAMITA
jgi:hypothetical protein